MVPEFRDATIQRDGYIVKICVRRNICATYKNDDDTCTDSVDTTLVRFHTRLLCAHVVSVLPKI